MFVSKLFLQPDLLGLKYEFIFFSASSGEPLSVKIGSFCPACFIMMVEGQSQLACAEGDFRGFSIK